MSAALYALGRWAYRSRRLVLAVWIGILLVLFAGAGLLGVGTDNTYKIPGTESQDALDALARTFPQVSGTSAQLIAVAPDGQSVMDADFESAVEASAADIAEIPQVSSANSPYASVSQANIAADDSAVLVPIQLSVGTTAVLPSTSQALQDAGVALQAVLPEGSEVSVGGQLFSQSATGISITELLGIAVAFFVLLLTFLSAIAAGIPLVTALLGVGASLSIVLIATRFTTITSTTPLLALMLGLAVGIDYALFILARHQDQLKDGVEPEEAAARSIATSGSAVVFAAITVVIALLGLSIAGIPFLTTMGVAAALAVSMAVVISLTLTPALLGFARWHVVPKKHRPAAGGKDAAGEASDHVDVSDVEVSDSPAPDAELALIDPAEEEVIDEEAKEEASGAPPARGFFRRWVRTVTARPIVTIVLIVAALATAAVPVMHLRLALPDAGSLEDGSPGRVTYDLIAEHFGPGYNGPLLVMGSIIESDDPVGLMDDLGAEIAGVDGVASVPLSTPNESADTGIVQVIPEGGPDSEATAQLVATLRSMHDQFVDEYGVSLAVTGYTAAGIDISAQLGGALLPFGLIVVGLSLVLLAMVFRSIVVPITAALGYVLSVGAALGLTTLVFVDGFLAGPLNVADVGTVVSFMPIILMGVLFGLAMDYEVFLVSRMREDYVHHGDAVDAVHDGFVASAKVVTAAATIMFAVFVAFVPEGDANIQPIAFGLAVGVVIDAFIVRMALIPAILVLFGDRAWRMPHWLDRALPHFDIEGEGLGQELALADWPEGDVVLVAEGFRAGGPDDTPDARAVDLSVVPGSAVVLQGGAAIDRRRLLAALSGRGPVLEGRAKVAGLLLPTRAGAVRERTAYWSMDASPDRVSSLADALAARPVILMLEGLDDLADPAEREDVRRRLGEALVADPRLCLVVAARDAAAVADALPDMPVEIVELAPALAESR